MSPPPLLRNIPSVSELLSREPLKKLVDHVSHNVVVDGVRNFLDDFREEIRHRTAEFQMPSINELAQRIAANIISGEEPTLRPVINATGILLHTGLGRAPLADAATAALVAVARDYASVEVDLATGRRARRENAVRQLLLDITGAQAALVVNNNAGATLLALAAIASGKEVIVSRGHLVEIGGSYRLPDVMSASGACLREVGTTNKTHLSDFAGALNESTGALMRVHTSNYRIVGFTEQPSLAALVRLAQQHQVPLIDDIGSGARLDLSAHGCPEEPLASRSIAAGADLVLFSGDKLLGGPQAGILVGRRELIERIRQHPLTRALRVDKLTLAAMAATLRLYRDPQHALREVPLLSLMSTPLENLRLRAQQLAEQLACVSAIATAQPREAEAYVGGGSNPAQSIPTWCVAVQPAGFDAGVLAAQLRGGSPAVMGRVQDGAVLLDLRSVFARQDQQLVQAVTDAAKRAM